MVDLSEQYAVDESDVEPGAELRGANLSNADLADAELEDAALTEANVGRAGLTNADFEGPSLRTTTRLRMDGGVVDRSDIVAAGASVDADGA